MLRYVLISALALLTCNANPYISNLLIQNPIVHSVARTSGEIISNTVEVFTKWPIAVADLLGFAYIAPLLNSRKNVIDYSHRFVRDYRSNKKNEDAVLNIEQLVCKYGFKMETHNVKTDDGYILTVYRIPKNGPVVFLMHGVLGSADDFIVSGPDNGLAYLLSNEGYDVWMGNARGNKHSRRHVQLHPSDPKFWDFSWHEIGYYDLPAMIDYALSTSNSSTLKYIGHSQGTTTFFVMASEREEYNKKIALMVALSPVAFMGKVKSPVARLLAPGISLLHGVASSIGLYEFLPDSGSMRIFKDIVCGSGMTAEIICNNFLFLFAGFDLAQINVTTLPVLLGHTPSGASAKQFVHYGQNIIAKDFRKYNYGTRRNLKHYGSTLPPKYALHRITAPVSLFYSEGDWLAHPDDVDSLYAQLPNVVDMHKVQFKHFSHLDFLLAKDFKILIYDRLRKLLSLY